MDSSQITVLLLIALLLVILPSVGLYKLFIRAGRPGWQAFIPFYNTWVMLEVAKKPKWWFFAQFVPIAGWFFSLVILIEFIKLFNKGIAAGSEEATCLVRRVGLSAEQGS